MPLEQAIQNCFTSQTDDGYVYLISPDFPAFNGHFPGNPLLPAVCQLGFCAHALSVETGKKLEISAVSRSKFMRPVTPGMEIKITLTLRPDGQVFAEFSDVKNGTKLSQIIFSARERSQESL